MNLLVTSWIHHPHRERGLAAAALTLALLLSACSAPSQPTNQPAALPPADLQLAHLQQAAYYYARYHALALRRRSGQAPGDLLGPSTGSGRRLKRLAEVCTALEDPSTGLRAGAGVEDESCREAALPVAEEQGSKEKFAICNSQFARGAGSPHR